MTGRTLNLAVAGAGGIGKHHAEAIASLDGARLAAICDIDADKACALAVGAGEGGGALMNQAIHMVDMLQWMVGDAVEIYGRWATLKHGAYANVEDTTVAVVTFANGAIASIQALTTLEPPYGFRLTVHGLS